MSFHLRLYREQKCDFFVLGSVRVLEISPAEEDPVFEEVACLHLKMNCEFTDEISLHRSSVVMQIRVSGSRMALIWDFVKRRYMIWKMGFAYGVSESLLKLE